LWPGNPPNYTADFDAASVEINVVCLTLSCEFFKFARRKNGIEKKREYDLVRGKKNCELYGEDKNKLRTRSVHFKGHTNHVF
jgi:hypothetical protein